MRRTLSVLCFALWSVAHTASAADLTITIDNIRATTGTLRIALYNSEPAWNGKTPALKTLQTRVSAKTQRIDFKGLPPGTYAVMLYNDENGNGKLDAGVYGQPVEGYGISNNPMVPRKPTWSESKFELPAKGRTTAIEMK